MGRLPNQLKMMRIAGLCLLCAIAVLLAISKVSKTACVPGSKAQSCKTDRRAKRAASAATSLPPPTAESGKHGDSRYWRGLLNKAESTQQHATAEEEREWKAACERYSFGAKSLESCMAQEKKKKNERVMHERTAKKSLLVFASTQFFVPTLSRSFRSKPKSSLAKL